MKTFSAGSRKLFEAISCVALASCASGSEFPTRALDLRSPDEPVAARIVEDTVQLSRTSDGIAFKVTAIIYNRSDRPVFKGGRCEPDAQVQVAEGWESVTSPICLGGAAVKRIQPADSLVVPVVIYGFTRVGMEPYFDPRKAHGIFRIVFAVSFDDPAGDSPQFTELSSSKFIVVDPASTF